MSLLAFLFLASSLLGQFGIAPNIPPVRSASAAVCEPGIILFILHQNEHFATDFGKPPIIFENPTYTSKDTAITEAQPATAPVRNHSPFWQSLLLLSLVLWNNVPLASSQPSLRGRKHSGPFLGFTLCSHRTGPRTEDLKTIRILGFGHHSGGASQEQFHPEWQGIQRHGRHGAWHTQVLCEYL